MRHFIIIMLNIAAASCFFDAGAAFSKGVAGAPTRIAFILGTLFLVANYFAILTRYE